MCTQIIGARTLLATPVTTDLVKLFLVWRCFDCCMLCYHFTAN